MGSYPDLRPDGLHPPDDARAGRRASTATRLGAADQPGDRRRSTRPGSTFKIDHRAGRRSKTATITPTNDDLRRRLDHGRRPATSKTPAAPPTARSPRCSGARSLLRRLLLHARRSHVGQRRPAATGRTSSGSAGERASTCPASRRACCRRQPGATSSTAKAAPNGPGRPATTSSSPSARATCRPTRCRWRSPTRRSATAARSSPRTSRKEVEDAAGRVLREFEPPPAPQVEIDPPTAAAILDGLHDAAQAPRRNLLRRLRRLPDRQSRARPAPRSGRPYADQSWYVVLAPYPDPEIVTAVTFEEGGFGADTAAPAALQILRSLLRQERQADWTPPAPTVEQPRMIRDPHPPRPPRGLRGPGPASPSGSACPTWTPPLAFARDRPRRLQRLHPRPGDADDVPGDPGYFVDRQTIYAVLGLVGMYAARPRRLFALPRAAGRHLHLPLRQHLSRLRLRLRGARLAARLRPALLQLPAIGAGQAPARTGACRLRHRRRPAGLGEAAHGALPLPRPRTGCARLPAAGPRHRSGVRGHHPRRDVRGGRPLDALRGRSARLWPL